MVVMLVSTKFVHFSLQPTNIKPSAEDISKISQTRSQLNDDLGGPGGKPGGGRHQEQGWKNFEKLSQDIR